MTDNFPWEALEFYKGQTKLWVAQDKRKSLLIDSLRADITARDNQIKHLTANLLPPDPPENPDTIDFGKLRELYTEVFPLYTTKFNYSDSIYQITTIANIREFVDWSQVNTMLYEPWVDCDDFTFALMGDFSRYRSWSGFPVALVWGYWPERNVAHAFISVVAYESETNKTPRIYYIEPQNDQEIIMEGMGEFQLYILVV